MNSQNPISEGELAGLVDGLVCGDLDEGARGRVLAWLEEDPARWRLCGLAFLEAQTWSQTLGQWPAADSEPVPVLSLPRSRRQTKVRRALAAATLIVAFGLGLALRDAVIPRKPSRDRPIADNWAAAPAPAATGGKSDGAAGNEPVFAALDVRTGDGFGPSAPIRIPVMPAGVAAGHAQEVRYETEIPEYVRQQWERQGYKVSFERRFLFARLPDGQQVAVPVDQVHVNPIPVSIN
jgi:hypothetical protein